MKHLVEFLLEDGSTVLVESDEPEKGPVVRGIAAHEITERAEQTFEAALETIRPIAAAIIAKLRNLADSPEQIGVEFGVKLGAKAGAFLASADTEATFKVTLTWKREQTAPGSDPHR